MILRYANNCLFNSRQRFAIRLIIKVLFASFIKLKSDIIIFKLRPTPRSIFFILAEAEAEEESSVGTSDPI